MLSSPVISIIVSLLSSTSERVRLAAVKCLGKMCIWDLEYRKLVVQLKPFDRILEYYASSSPSFRLESVELVKTTLFLTPRAPKAFFTSAHALLKALYLEPNIIVQRAIVTLTGILNHHSSDFQMTTPEEFVTFCSVGFPSAIFQFLSSPYGILQNGALSAASSMASAGAIVIPMFEKECLPRVVQLYCRTGDLETQSIALGLLSHLVYCTKTCFLKPGIEILDVLQRQLLDADTPIQLCDIIIQFLRPFANSDPDPKNLARRGFITHIIQIFPRLKKENSISGALEIVMKMIQKEKKTAYYDKVKEINGWNTITGFQKHKNAEISNLAKQIMKKING